MTRTLLAGLVAAALLGGLAGPAAADAPRNGYGFAVADDGGPATLDTEFFDRLRPQAFRFMVPWNAAFRPDQLARANQIILAARAHGVRQVAVSFNHDGSKAAPDVTQYTQAVASFVQQYAGVVDAWGPANEPNCPGGWSGLNGAAGAQRTAQMYNVLLFIMRVGADPTATMLSPDFCDYYSEQGQGATSIASWMHAYTAASGGFGDVIAWHPYWDVHYRGAARVCCGPGFTAIGSTQDLINNVNGNPIWVTEAGGFGVNPGRDITDDETTQNQAVAWMTGTLAHNDRIQRIYYYSMYSNPLPGWDTGLLRSDGTRRPTWFTWCVESHGGAAFHPDCTG